MGFLVVVKRDEPDLFQYLQHHFHEPEVRVVLDRRHDERRSQNGNHADDRRRHDRRLLAASDDPLWRYGFRVAVAQIL